MYLLSVLFYIFLAVLSFILMASSSTQMLPDSHPLHSFFMPELQKCVFNSLLDISPWTSPRHFKLNTSLTKFLVFLTQSPSIPLFFYFSGQFYHLISHMQAKNLEVKLDWVFSCTTHIYHLINSFSKLQASPVTYQVLF